MDGVALERRAEQRLRLRELSALQRKAAQPVQRVGVVGVDGEGTAEGAARARLVGRCKARRTEAELGLGRAGARRGRGERDCLRARPVRVTPRRARLSRLRVRVRVRARVSGSPEP